MNLVLASTSPRRRELLAILGFPFTVVAPEIDEAPFANEDPEAYTARVARDKGIDVAKRVSNSTVLSADTVVTIDKQILGKPIDEADAFRMLKLLSGRSHAVLTAVTVIDQVRNETREGIDSTTVWFEPLTDDRIREYIRKENVLDKAGAYGIQGPASVFIPKIEGNYNNVMGLPLPLVHRLLCRTLS